MSETNETALPLFPMKNSVLFPPLALPVAASRPMSIAAIESAVATEEKELLVFSQRDAQVQQPGRDDLFGVGTRAVIRRLSPVTTGGVQLLVQGIERVRLKQLVQEEPYLVGAYEPAPVVLTEGVEVEALAREVTALAGKVVSLARPGVQEESIDLSQFLGPDGDRMRLVYMIGSLLPLELADSQRLLEADELETALQYLHTHLQHEIRVLEVRQQIATKAQSEMTKQHREVLLRQQLRAIQEELGETEDAGAELEALRERFAEADLPDEVRSEAERELKRLARIPTALAEFGVLRAHLETILDLPWSKKTEAVLDLKRAREVMDEDHLHLEEVKDRILEHLAVMKLNPEAKSPILTFVGPPGVGKTSLGRSIARALNREFERMSLGGLHDEAELRGHRRTYIGAMPGRILQALRRVGVNNPVLMLDEIDKLGRDFRGDPAAAMLEILDPQQNAAFRDNYLDMPFDLSKVFFITTANALDTIPRPLLDRMEVLRLSGYSEEEKLAIAKRYILPRQLSEAGLEPTSCRIEDAALALAVRSYTREAGVRQLERVIGRMVRKVALQFAEGNTEPISVGEEALMELLGPALFVSEKLRENAPPGVAAGLAWTESGGDVLYIESTLLPGGSGLTLTGQLGDVMQESARAARSYLWSNAERYGMDPALFREHGVHVHVPAGAIPKDGPSAGITIVTALASLYSGKPVRSDTAMTGEVTITGLVLPIGGVKEKVLAARRAGFSRVILPRQNEPLLSELPSDVRESTEFVLVERIGEVLAASIPALVFERQEESSEAKT